VPGMDAAGTVEAVGAGVEGFAVGDRVFGSVGKPYLGAGTLAEFVTVSAGTVTHTPSSIDDTVAAAIPTAGVTALVMADALGARFEGWTVVVVGATGGVGGSFVQLAVHRGARVVAVCRGENADYARALGATEVIDYTATDVVDAVRSGYPDCVDAVADLHGDAVQVADLATLVAPGGHVVSAVGVADVEALAGEEIKGLNAVGRVTNAHLETILGLLANGDVVAPEIKTYPLADAAEALVAVGSGHVRGKLVVTVP
jgi:NADPH2:quinone reductase